MDHVIAMLASLVFGLPATFLLHEAGHVLVGRLLAEVQAQAAALGRGEGQASGRTPGPS